jgi:hypothetical protein
MTPAVTVVWKPSGLPTAIAKLAGKDRVGIAELRRNLVRRGDPQYRQIGMRIIADHTGGVAHAVDECHVDRRGAGDDVTVREDESVRREEEPRSSAALFAALALRFHLDVHDGRRDARRRRRDRGRVRIEKIRIIVRVARLRLRHKFGVCVIRQIVELVSHLLSRTNSHSQCSLRAQTLQLLQSTTASSDAKGDSGMARAAKATTDHDEIRRWVEARGGHPAHVTASGTKKGPGILRIDYPGFSGEDTLEPIEWDEFFDAFDKNKLAFLYQDSPRSRFSKLVDRQTVTSPSGKGNGATKRSTSSRTTSARTTRKAATTTSRKATSATRSTSTKRAKSSATSRRNASAASGRASTTQRSRSAKSSSSRGTTRSQART